MKHPETKIKPKKLDDYPLFLTAEHIKEILGISKSKAYDVMKTKGFPLIPGLGKTMRVPRDAFFQWAYRQQLPKSNEFQAFYNVIETLINRLEKIEAALFQLSGMRPENQNSTSLFYQPKEIAERENSFDQTGRRAL